jgi:hypothetical protein
VAPSIRKRWQSLRRQAAIARSVEFVREFGPWSFFYEKFKLPNTEHEAPGVLSMQCDEASRIVNMRRWEFSVCSVTRLVG